MDCDSCTGSVGKANPGLNSRAIGFADLTPHESGLSNGGGEARGEPLLDFVAVHYMNTTPGFEAGNYSWVNCSGSCVWRSLSVEESPTEDGNESIEQLPRFP